MKYGTSTLAFIALIPFFDVAYADQEAITKDGRTVILKDDGTWEYAKEDAGELKKGHFRDASWGMSKDQVRKVEKLEINKGNDEMLYYDGEILNLECLVVYHFVRDKLVRGSYLITQEHTNKNDYISDYNVLKDSLKKKYGEPKKDKEIWKNALWKDNPEQWGFAVSYGHLKYYTKWKTEDTDIMLFLSGENFNIAVHLGYESIRLGVLEEKKREKEALDDL